MPEEPALPPVQAIGFFAAGPPIDRAALEKALRGQFQRLLAAKVRGLAVSPLAGLADLSFASEALQAGFPLSLLLLTTPEALAAGFPREVHEELENVLRKAATVEVLHFSFSEIATTIHLAQRLVDQVNILVVLQKSAQDEAGSEMISYATCRGRTVVSVAQAAGRVEASPVAAAENPASEDVASLCALLGPPPVPPAIPDEVTRYFEACDDEATRSAPQVRRYVLNIFLANSLATVAGSVSSSFPRSPAVGVELNVVKAVSILLGLGIFAMLQHQQSQNRWLRLRLKAEICRSIMATWNSPHLIEPFSADEIPEMGEVIRSLHYLRIAQPHRPKVSLAEFKAHYGVRRLAHQYLYFKGQSHAAERASKWLSPLYWVFSCAALITSGVDMALHSFLQPGTWVHFLFVFVPLVAPILASGVMAWQAIESVGRKKVRFAEMKRLMQVALVDLVHSSSWESVHHVVKRAEKALLSEVLEWYSFVKLK